MVKRRGYRIELGEIEPASTAMPASAKPRSSRPPTTRRASRSASFGRDGARPSIIEMKTFCARHLPAYMIPDAFAFLERLPRTSTDKVDYQALRQA